MTFVKRYFVAALLAVAMPALADAAAPLAARLHLTHLSPERWRADYEFAEPVVSIDLDPSAGDYRAKAWHILTPGIVLDHSAGHDTLSAGGKPFSSLSVEVGLYTDFAQGGYTPFDRFSDGGADVYVGYFGGDAHRAGEARPLQLTVALTGLPGETVIPPDNLNAAEPDYAYFGPAKPAPIGVANAVIDPKLPAWVAALVQDTTDKVTTLYDRKFGRPLRTPPLLLISVDSLDTPGLTMKGGAVKGQIAYRFGGDFLVRENPALRHKLTMHIAEHIAHELSHIWQQNVGRGGIGGSEIWVHEGGAEAIATAALADSGLFSQAEAEGYAQKLLKDCAQEKGSLETYAGAYACGFKRFHDYQVDIYALWKSLMETTEATGKVYSSEMVEAIIKRPKV